MTYNTTVEQDYQQNTMSASEAQQAGQLSAQNGVGCAPQQPNEPESIYQQRLAAYEQTKQQMEQQKQQQ